MTTTVTLLVNPLPFKMFFGDKIFFYSKIGDFSKIRGHPTHTA